MSVTHASAVRNLMVDAVLTEIDAGTGAGYIELLTSGDAEVATMVFSDPAGVVSGAVLTFDPVNNDASAAGGVVGKFRIRKSDAVDQMYGTVAVSGGDLTISDTTVIAGDIVSLSLFTYTAPL
jgi:hypothetical protein